MSSPHSNATSVNLQIRILLGITLLLMVGLILTKVFQEATVGVRLEAQADDIRSLQNSVDQLQQKALLGSGVRPPGGQGVGPSQEQATIAALQAELEALRHGSAAGLAAPNSYAGPVPGMGGSQLPSTVPDPADALAPALSLPLPPPSPRTPTANESDKAKFVEAFTNQEPVAVVSKVSPDGSFVILEPMRGFSFAENDSVVLGRPEDGPVALLVISKVEENGLAIADKLENQQSLIGDLRVGDLACFY